MPIVFDFTPANYHGNPILIKLISTITLISINLNTPTHLNADKGYYNYKNIEACTINSIITIIYPKKNLKVKTYEKFFQIESKVFRIHSKLPLSRNNFENN